MQNGKCTGCETSPQAAVRNVGIAFSIAQAVVFLVVLPYLLCAKPIRTAASVAVDSTLTQSAILMAGLQILVTHFQLLGQLLFRRF